MLASAVTNCAITIALVYELRRAQSSIKNIQRETCWWGLHFYRLRDMLTTRRLASF